MKLFILSLIAFLLHSPFTYAQPLKPGEWKAMTSMRSVRDVAVAADSLHAWAVTSGGAFRIDLADTSQAIQSLRTTEGLSTNDLTAVACDHQGHVFFGGSTGSLDILDESTGKVRRFNDISKSDYTNKRINSLAVFGERVYISTAYGLSVFQNTGEGFFLATVAHFGTLPLEDSVHQTIEFNGYIYCAVQEGIVVAQRDALLSNFQNWSLIPSRFAVLSVTAFNNVAYAGTTDTLFTIASDRSQLFPTSFPGKLALLRMMASPDSLYLLTPNRVLFSTRDAVTFASTTLLSGTDAITAIALGKPNRLIIATTFSGLAEISGEFSRTNIYPAGPLVNLTAQISFSPTTGLLYVANGDAGVGTFDPATDSWMNYAAGVGNTPREIFNKVLYDSIRNVTWFSCAGIGMYVVKDLGVASNPTWELRDRSNGLPPFIPGPNTTFMVVRGGMIDRDGQFVVTSWTGTGEGLSLTNDGKNFTRYKLTNDVSIGLPFGCVTQDLDGNYWVGTEANNAPQPIGVYWVRADGTANGNIQGGPGQQLPSAAINAILTDQDNEIWAGTQQGAHIISNPYEVNSSSNPKFSIREVKLVSQQVVHTMATDGVGNKWIGTENGIFVVSPDGSDSVAHFSKENSPLMDNLVLSLTLDTKRGEAFAATPSGISRFSTIFKQGSPDYSGIRVYPNPVVQSGEQSPSVFIDGLVSGSTVKIFTLRGELVAAINGQSYGSTVQWNGRDDAGHALPSGMYLVSATSPQSGENGEAKLVIVRKP